MLIRACRLTLVLVALAWLAGCATQRSIGLIGNDVPKTVVTFDLDTQAVQGGINVPSRGDRDAYALAPGPKDQVYVSNRLGQIYRVMVDASAPSVARSPVTPSHTASDLAPAGNGRPVVVTVGTDTASTAGVVSTVHMEDGTELDRLPLGETTPYAVDVCDDNRTVLVGTDTPHAIRKLTVHDGGRLRPTGSMLVTRNPVSNVYCAPGSQTGIVVSSTGATMQSFAIDTMKGIDARDLAGQSGPARSLPLGLSGVFASDGTRFFVRSERGDFVGNGFVEAFDIDPVTGALGADPMRADVAPLASASRGTQEIALGADGRHLYVTDPRNDRVLVLDPSSLTTIATITDPRLDAPFGIALSGAN